MVGADSRVEEVIFTVEVAYAGPHEQAIVPLEIRSGTTVEEAIHGSKILERFEEIDPQNLKVGIFGKLSRLDAVLKPKDRVEIYRPLIADPKEVRKQRAKKGGEAD